VCECRVQAHHTHQLQHVGQLDVAARRRVVQLHYGRLGPAVGYGQVQVEMAGGPASSCCCCGDVVVGCGGGGAVAPGVVVAEAAGGAVV
jgi:hypothetical protein